MRQTNNVQDLQRVLPTKYKSLKEANQQRTRASTRQTNNVQEPHEANQQRTNVKDASKHYTHQKEQTNTVHSSRGCLSTI